MLYIDYNKFFKIYDNDFRFNLINNVDNNQISKAYFIENDITFLCQKYYSR